MVFKNCGARFASLSLVRPRVMTVSLPQRETRSRISRVGFGVVATTHARFLPRRRAEHQHVPGLRIPPRAELVAQPPHRTAGLSIAPAHPRCRRLQWHHSAMSGGASSVHTPPIPPRRAGKDAGVALDHHVTRIRGGRSDQGDAARTGLHLVKHPFGQHTGLPEASPASSSHMDQSPGGGN